MKVGILTLPILNNYGGILQAYALQTALKKMGHEPYMVMRRLDELPWYAYPYDKLHFYLNRLKGEKKQNDIIYETRKRIYGDHLIIKIKKFIDLYISPKTEYYYSSDEMREKIGKEKFEAYIVGSDQVWRPKYSSNIYDYFLDFIDDGDIIKIAYAASFGTSDWEYNKEQTFYCKELVSKFTAISVREKDAINMVEENFKQIAEQVLDPTMLLTAKDYIESLELTLKPKFMNSIFAYILDTSEEAKDIVDYVSTEMNMELSILNFTDQRKYLFQKRDPYPAVESWLEAFYSSPFIVTDSFHGCVFSILFNKPFIVYGNKERGFSRFTSLLRMLGLENRLCSEPKDVNRVLKEEINWSEVNEILEQNRKRSYSFLESNLKKKEL